MRPIGSVVIDVLRSIRKRGESGQFVLPSLRRQHPLLGLAKAWTRVITSLQLAELSSQGQPLTPHGLRHAFGSTAEELGYTVPTIGALLGHAGHGITMAYIPQTDGALIAAADRVSRYIWSAMADEDNIVSLKPAVLQEALSGAA